MKKALFLMALLALVKVGFSQQVSTPAPVLAPVASPAPAVETASIQWEAQAHDFGKIKQGIPVTHEFKFTNTGNVPLIITNVQASCGCTVPTWSKEPVLPHAQGFIKATFSAGALGPFDKTVTVTGNLESGMTQLKIRGEVSSEPAQ